MKEQKTYTKLMKDNKDQALTGLISGASKYLGINVTAFRTVVVIGSLISGFFLSAMLYFIAANFIVPTYNKKYDLKYLKTKEKHDNKNSTIESKKNKKSVFIKEI
jgi:phage shock protein PspC (stress-responsive transcriptional regulator)